MRVRDFPFDRFLKFKEEKDKNLRNFIEGKLYSIPVVQMASSEHWGPICRDKEKSLEAQLDFMHSSMSLKSDLLFSYLEPWLGVGVYANAFGCRYEWSEHEAPQTRAIYSSVDELKGIKYPSTKDCEIMRMIIEMIRYFKEKTGGILDIALTDTQSPNDNASLILDACEFFVASVTEPETLAPFLKMITDLMIEFTDMQMEAIGDSLTLPGHIMLSHKGFKGISLSDDNMAVISPASFENTCLPYNNILSKYYGGIAIHSCGNFAQNGELLMKTENLTMVDLALGTTVDPNPNDPVNIKKIFKKSGVITKAKIGYKEIERLEELIDPDIKLIVQLCTDGTMEERNSQYEKVKDWIESVQVRKRNGSE